MKPERSMKMGTKRFKPVDTLKIRVVTRAPRTSSPVGKLEYETSKVIKSIDTESRPVVSRGYGVGWHGGIDRDCSVGTEFPFREINMFGTRWSNGYNTVNGLSPSELHTLRGFPGGSAAKNLPTT